MVLAKGSPLTTCVERGADAAEGRRHAGGQSSRSGSPTRRAPRSSSSGALARASPEPRRSALADPGRPRRAAAASRSRSSARSSSSRSSSSLVVTSPGWPAVKQPFFDGEIFRESLPASRDAFLLNMKIFLIAEVVILVAALADRGAAEPPGPGLLPAARARDRLHRPLPRRPDDPRHLHPRLRRAGARDPRACRRRRSSGGSSRSCSSTRPTWPRSTGRGSSRCIRARRRPRARSGSRAASRCGSCPAPGRAPRRPAAAERLHRPPEGHGPRRADRRRRGVPPVADRGRRRASTTRRTWRPRCSSCS